MRYKEIQGDLIELAKAGSFDAIGHGCNCFCTMKRGIAPIMAREFQVDLSGSEAPSKKGDINKLGCVDYVMHQLPKKRILYVVNMYTQYHFTDTSKYGIPLDYDALRSCLHKMNKMFKNKTIGLPKIGAGLAGGDWNTISRIIQEEMTDCYVTVVVLPNKGHLSEIEHVKEIV